MVEPNIPVEHGNMDVTEQRTMYHRFLVMVRWAAVAHLAAITLLVLWFASGAGFLAALISAIVVAVAAGYLVLHMDSENAITAAGTLVMTTVVENEDPISRISPHPAE
jgi:hypothetical protein